MDYLPDIKSLLVRTDFADEARWNALVEEVARENEDGFRAYVSLVDDTVFKGADRIALKARLTVSDNRALVLFAADVKALASPDCPILVVDISGDHEPFRCVASELWGVENNLNIANMDWEEFSDNVGSDGVFRGFD